MPKTVISNVLFVCAGRLFQTCGPLVAKLIKKHLYSAVCHEWTRGTWILCSCTIHLYL